MNASTMKWAGKVMENDAGHLRYSKVHAWDDDGHALCGTAEPRGEWVAAQDSIGDTCRKCERAAA